MFIFAIVFMDYEVFLCRASARNTTAPTTTRNVRRRQTLAHRTVITAPTLIMVCVFGSFVFGAEVALKRPGGADGHDDRAPGARAVNDVLRQLELVVDYDRILPRINVESSTTLDEDLTAMREDEQPTPVPWTTLRRSHASGLCERRNLEGFGQVSRARHPCGTGRAR